RGYFQQRYSPRNITVVGVGSLDFDKFVDKISEGCSRWTTLDVGRETPHTDGSGKTRVIRDAKVFREHIGLMSPGPERQSEKRFAGELLATIIGDTNGSRLYYALVEPAIADEATMSYAPMDNAGALATFLSTEPDRASQALRITRKVLEEFADTGPSERELLAAKNKIASGATLKGELPMGRLATVGFDWIYRREYIPLPEQIEMLFAVERGEVHELARECDLPATTVVALGPVENL
ncbi:unnamed protein product, partial [marine sediment metagenome]